jgi:hypothetical protein
LAAPAAQLTDYGYELVIEFGVALAPFALARFPALALASTAQLGGDGLVELGGRTTLRK